VPDTRGGLERWAGPTHTNGGWRRGRARAALGDAAGRWSVRLHTTLLD
jgi:hypothetical protein